MKLQFIKSLADVTFGDSFPMTKEEWVGKAARINLGNGKIGIMLVLPCRHVNTIDTRWNITGIDTDTPSATPSILCTGNEQKSCWHGYLTNGELNQV